MSLVIRKAQLSDLEALQRFFVKAYGAQTVFQSADFLLYYYGTDSGKPALSNSTIGVNEAGEVVSHYGGLEYQLVLGKEVVPVVWGVNAFTVPEYRGQGLNGRMVEQLQANNPVNGAVGMLSSTADFYARCGYNVFGKERYTRFVYAPDPAVFEIVAQIGQDVEKARTLLHRPAASAGSEPIVPAGQLISLTKENLPDYELALGTEVRATTYRDQAFLMRRLLANPYIAYQVFACVEGGRLVAYAALREEQLQPTAHVAGRIIDLYGKKSAMAPLLEHLKRHARARQLLYLDFSMFGTYYEPELQAAQFVRLADEDYSLLPQVSAPVEYRPNLEYFTMYSTRYPQAVADLKREEVYFTRVDSDRDRISRITQIAAPHA